jgi:hypothetical protein
MKNWGVTFPPSKALPSPPNSQTKPKWKCAQLNEGTIWDIHVSRIKNADNRPDEHVYVTRFFNLLTYVENYFNFTVFLWKLQNKCFYENASCVFRFFYFVKLCKRLYSRFLIYLFLWIVDIWKTIKSHKHVELNVKTS